MLQHSQDERIVLMLCLGCWWVKQWCHSFWFIRKQGGEQFFVAIIIIILSGIQTRAVFWDWVVWYVCSTSSSWCLILLAIKTYCSCWNLTLKILWHPSGHMEEQPAAIKTRACRSPCHNISSPGHRLHHDVWCYNISIAAIGCRRFGFVVVPRSTKINAGINRSKSYRFIVASLRQQEH